MNTMPERPSMTVDTTTAPLTISKTLGLGSLIPPPPVMPIDIDCFYLANNWMYIDNFHVRSITAINAEVYKFNGFAPAVRAFTWDVFRYGIAQDISYDYELKFLFVKLPDCRLSFDLIKTYNVPGRINQSPFTPDPDVKEMTILEIDEDYTITVPMRLFWNGVPAYNSANESISHGDLPVTTLSLRMRQQYVPTALQPEHIEVLVFARLLDPQYKGIIVDPFKIPLPFNRYI